MTVERKFHELKSEAIAAVRSGDNARARGLLLRVANRLHSLAESSRGGSRTLRFHEAREMREAARRLDVDGAGAQVSSGGSGTGGDGTGGDGTGGDGTGGDGTGEDRFRVHETSKIRFEDIAGLEEVKEQFRLKLIYPLLHPEKAARYRVRKGGGLLLYGPPGTGKTLLARALAGEIDAEFFSVRPSEVLSKWVGEAERNIRKLFEEARAQPTSVIFVDEIDALAPRRGENSSPVMMRLVAQILAELEGFDGESEGSLLFLGATNEPWLLDPAILRPGRFDQAMYIGLPDSMSREKLLELHLAGRPLAADFDLKVFARSLDGFSGADIRELCDRAASRVFLEAVREEKVRSLSSSDFEAIARSMTSSVSPEALARYKDYHSGVLAKDPLAGNFDEASGREASGVEIPETEVLKEP